MDESQRYIRVILNYSSSHLVMCVTDRLFIQSSPVVRLVPLADFQEIASDRAPPLVQRSRPQQHQGAVPHLPELHIIGTT